MAKSPRYTAKVKSALLTRLWIRARRDARVLPLLEPMSQDNDLRRHRMSEGRDGNTGVFAREMKQEGSSLASKTSAASSEKNGTDRVQFLAEDMYDR